MRPFIGGYANGGSELSGFIMKTNGNNFGCDVSELTVIGTTVPAIPILTPTFNITNVVAPNSIIFETTNVEFSNDDLCVAVGINENNGGANSVEVFPNPSLDGKFEINNAQAEINSIRIIDVNGRLVHEEKLSSSGQSFKADLSSEPKGLYLISISTGKGNICKKVVVE